MTCRQNLENEELTELTSVPRIVLPCCCCWLTIAVFDFLGFEVKVGRHIDWLWKSAGSRDRGSGRAVQLYFGSRGRRWGRLLWVHQFTFLAREDFFDGGKKRP